MSNRYFKHWHVYNRALDRLTPKLSSCSLIHLSQGTPFPSLSRWGPLESSMSSFSHTTLPTHQQVRLGLLSRYLQNPAPFFHLHCDHPGPRRMASPGWKQQPPHWAPCSHPHLTACSLLSRSLLCLNPSSGSPAHGSTSPSPSVTCKPLRFLGFISMFLPSPPTQAIPAPPCSLNTSFLSLCGRICCSLYLESSSCSSPHGSHLTSSFTHITFSVKPSLLP